MTSIQHSGYAGIHVDLVQELFIHTAMLEKETGENQVLKRNVR